ncbi:MAG: hypothetical protein BWK78_05830 [Thiotrichaceae bacterium IS1]|nr:MAG: hypothetical protein BWK78_05830 [Thiotrichaceae bacterium IS1]
MKVATKPGRNGHAFWSPVLLEDLTGLEDLSGLVRIRICRILEFSEWGDIRLILKCLSILIRTNNSKTA